MSSNKCPQRTSSISEFVSYFLLILENNSRTYFSAGWVLTYSQMMQPVNLWFFLSDWNRSKRPAVWCQTARRPAYWSGPQFRRTHKLLAIGVFLSARWNRILSVVRMIIYEKRLEACTDINLFFINALWKSHWMLWFLYRKNFHSARTLTSLLSNDVFLKETHQSTKNTSIQFHCLDEGMVNRWIVGEWLATIHSQM